jgi:general stress protein YciG
MDPKRLSEISAKGGRAIGRDSEHMARIGRLGGLKNGENIKKALADAKRDADMEAERATGV